MESKTCVAKAFKNLGNTAWWHMLSRLLSTSMKISNVYTAYRCVCCVYNIRLYIRRAFLACRNVLAAALSDRRGADISQTNYKPGSCIYVTWRCILAKPPAKAQPSRKAECLLVFSGREAVKHSPAACVERLQGSYRVSSVACHPRHVTINRVQLCTMICRHNRFTCFASLYLQRGNTVQNNF